MAGRAHDSLVYYDWVCIGHVDNRVIWGSVEGWLPPCRTVLHDDCKTWSVDGLGSVIEAVNMPSYSQYIRVCAYRLQRPSSEKSCVYGVVQGLFLVRLLDLRSDDNPRDVLGPFGHDVICQQYM